MLPHNLKEFFDDSTLLLESSWIIHNFNVNSNSLPIVSPVYESKYKSYIKWHISITMEKENMISFTIEAKGCNPELINLDYIYFLSPYDHTTHLSVPVVRPTPFTFCGNVSLPELEVYIGSMHAEKIAIIEWKITIKRMDQCVYESIFLVSNKTMPYKLQKDIEPMTGDDAIKKYIYFNTLCQFKNGLGKIKLKISNTQYGHKLEFEVSSDEYMSIIGDIHVKANDTVTKLPITNTTKPIINIAGLICTTLTISVDLCAGYLIEENILEYKNKIYYYNSTLLSLHKLIDDNFSDVVLIGNDKVELKAHKCILASRSSVFELMLNTPMSEMATSRINIADYSSNIIRAMLNFIYSEIYSNENPMDLLGIAHKYDLIKLQLYCARRLYFTINPENAPRLLEIVKRYGLSEFKLLICQYIVENISLVIGNDGWNQYIKSDVNIMGDILSIFANKQCG